jgi:Ca2+-transporting ATPase
MEGLRILAFAQNTTFLGMVALQDPPRPEVKQALIKARGAGISVVMITGDNEKTAEAIGRQVGLLKENDEIMTGIQLEKYTDQDLKEILPKIRIFARTTPLHKARIVKLYQDLGEIVAVTGDGVNDAIALKQADVGISMGKIGTDVARESSDMIITDDNFSTIIDAVEEGRAIVLNMKNAILFLLTTNLVEALALIGGLLLHISNLFIPIQLLFINLVTDSLPAISLAFAPAHSQLMKRAPQKQIALFDKKFVLYLLFASMMGTYFVLLSYFIFQKMDEGHTAAFVVLIVFQSFVLADLWMGRNIKTSLVHLHSKIFISAFLTPFLLLFSILFTPFLLHILRLEPISFFQFISLLFISFLILPCLRILRKIT